MSLQASGKAYEKRMAVRLGGTHIKRENFGESAPDIEHPRLVIECKLRKELALENWMQQVEEHEEQTKVCIVIAKRKNMLDEKSIVSMRLKDFLELLGGNDG